MYTTYFSKTMIMATFLLTTLVVGCEDDSTGPDIDPDAPIVFSTSPEHDDDNVARNKIVDIVFDQAMNPTTINTTTITLRQGSTTINGTIEYSGTTAKFVPENVLAAQTDYTVRVSTGAISATGVALANDKVWNFKTGGTSGQLEAINLRTAENYVVLARTAINNTPTSVFTGDLGLSPMAESFLTGFSQIESTGYSTSDQVTGRIYAADMSAPTPVNLTTAVEHMITAYNSAEGLSDPDFVELHGGQIGGKTLTPGLYKWNNSVLITSAVTFSGSATDVWVLQINENVTMRDDVTINLSGGALASNIYWQVGGNASIGKNSHLEGIILLMNGITMDTGASLNGRVLTRAAAIFDANTVTEPQ